MERFESYPRKIVFLSSLFSFGIYAFGACVLWILAPFVSVLYLVYCSVLEVRILRRSCPNCYYYGKTCCFGRGRVSALFFKKGDPSKFVEKHVSWRDILPDFMVTILPVCGGLVLLVTAFSWLVLALVVILIALGFPGSAFIRGTYACRYCRQRDLGCPALSLFEKKKPGGRDEPEASK